MPFRTPLRRLPALLTLIILAGCRYPTGETADRLIIGEVMMHSELQENLRAIALSGGRVSGTENARRAEDYVAQRLRDYGLSNVHFEPFTMSSWIVHETDVTLLSDPPRKLTGAVALGHTISTPSDGITAPLIDVGTLKTVEDFEPFRDRVAGKFVLVHDGGLHRSAKMALVMQAGAAGLVVMSPPDRDPIIGNGHRTPRPEPGVVIPYDEDLLARLAAGEELRLNIRLVTDNWKASPRNVVAEIPGRGPDADEIVILGAHLDGWHLGEAAIDNGNGSAAILETARALAAVHWQPNRTVRFVWFQGEELGLLGSKAYVAQHAGELDRVVAMVNADMPGSPRRVHIFGHPEMEPLIAGLIADLAGYEIDYDVGERHGWWSDHAPFMHLGIPTLCVGGELGDGVKNYHTSGDVYECVDRRATVEAAAVYGVLLRRLADDPERPAKHREPTGETDE